MKFAAVLCLILVCSSTFGLKTHKITNSEARKIQELKKSHSWGAIALNLAELHTLAQGPLEELLEALNQLLEDLNAKVQRANANFDKVTAAYQEEKRRLNGEIDQAKSDIANTQSLLNDVLYVQRDVLNEDIENLNTSIANTQQYLVELAAQRKADHQAYLVKVDEAKAAIAAIEECLDLLATLDGAASLAEVKKAKKSLEKVQSKLPKNSVESSMIKALVALSTSEFADQDAIGRVVELMNDVKNNLSKAIETFGQEEEAAQAAYEAEVEQKNNEIANMQATLAQKHSELEMTERMIEENEAFLAVRQNDLKNLQAELEAVEAQYVKDTEAYNDLIAELEKEIAATNAALEVIENAGFADYIYDRVSEYDDAVIDQAHGTGIEV